MPKRILILLTVLQVFTSIKGSEDARNAKRVVCYYAGLTGKQMKNLTPEDIDASVCTDIVYLHGAINKEDEVVYITSLFGEAGGTGYVERLARLKEVNPNLKLHLFVSPDSFPWLMESVDRRTKIIKSAVSLLNETQFDGLNFATSHPEVGREELSTFFCEMHAEFSKYGYMVSAAAAENLDSSLENSVIEKMSRCCDFITLPTIENWTIRWNRTRLIAPINETRTRSERYIKKGFPLNKLLITIPTLGLIYNLTDPNQTLPGSSISGPGEEETTYTDGFSIFYSMLSRRLNDTSEGWTIVRDEESNSPYAYSKAGIWASYEDEISVADKARYVLEKNLGGALIFTLDMEDYHGIRGKTFPLIRAIRDTFKQGASDS